MGEKSHIQWTDAVWNPVTGCTKVSAGCKNCYAERFASRRMGPWRDRAFNDVRCHEDRLDQPLHWEKPRKVFVNSMSDLFHEAVPRDFILRVFLVMARCPEHSFQILTKRPERMRRLVDEWLRPAMTLASGRVLREPTWPLPNVWLGVSVEDQATADERIPLLLQIPSALRFVSCEPLLGPMVLQEPWRLTGPPRQWLVLPGSRCLSWVIAGGESGPQARPCEVAWIRSLVRQAQAAHVPCFVKQLGANPLVTACRQRHYEWGDGKFEHWQNDQSGLWRVKLADRKGSDPSEWPADLRVREYPEVRA